jgi:ferredoxin
MAVDRREDASVIPRATVAERVTIDVAGLDALIGALRDGGRRVFGPTVRDRAVVVDEIESVTDLPQGWADEQEAATYRLHPSGDGALFGWAVGAHSWKTHLLPPRVTLWSAVSDGEELRIDEAPPDVAPRAFVGVRSCDVHAIAIQDRVLLGGEHPDPHYAARRDGVIVVAVHCGRPAATCFCASMGSGPRAIGGYDLALTELIDGPHRFLVEVATSVGAELLGDVPTRPATEADIRASIEVTAGAERAMTRSLDTEGLHDLLAANLEHRRWDDVASRCLACTNCTLVCPTCFCTAVEDRTDLTGERAERSRRWDSCFTLGHSALGGGAVRSTHRERYRQWLTHKLGTWIDQFGSSGCVGCGRCITWCPVGIDLTAEAAALRSDPTGMPVPSPRKEPVR